MISLFGNFTLLSCPAIGVCCSSVTLPMKKRRRAMPAPNFQQPETLLATADEVIQEQFCPATKVGWRPPLGVRQRRQTMSAMGAAFAESGHRGPCILLGWVVRDCRANSFDPRRCDGCCCPGRAAISESFHRKRPWRFPCPERRKIPHHLSPGRFWGSLRDLLPREDPGQSLPLVAPTLRWRQHYPKNRTQRPETVTAEMGAVASPF